MIEWVMEAGANPYVQNIQGKTALDEVKGLQDDGVISLLQKQMEAIPGLTKLADRVVGNFSYNAQCNGYLQPNYAQQIANKDIVEA